jgi:AraC-like DNA-binding protein
MLPGVGPMQRPANEWSATNGTSVEGVECFSAHFVAHVFDRHSHEEFAFGTTFDGVQSFRCRGQRRDSLPGHLMLLNPDEPHDGWAGERAGFAYRMLYVSTDGLAKLIDAGEGAGPGGGRGAAFSRGIFREPVVRDQVVAAEFASAAEDLLLPGNSLQAAERLSRVLRTVFKRYGGVTEPERRRGATARISRVRDLLESRFDEDVTIATVADVAGLSRVHATRQFTHTYGMPPHAYLNTVRIRHAKTMLRAGASVADVAVSVGFVDQSHFSRRFKRSMGVSPLAWVRSVTGRKTS